MAHKAGIIGLGVVGRRTFANLAAHDGFEIAAFMGRLDNPAALLRVGARTVPGFREALPRCARNTP